MGNMGNMSYCRFQNTVLDLRDCYYHMDDTDLSNEETQAMEALIETCKDIISAYGEKL
jgi:hypothetical protein